MPLDGTLARRHQQRVAPELVIFDCDGVLVDSEAIALDVVRQTLAGLGLPLGLDEVRERFLGRALPSIVADLREDGIDFDAGHRAAMDDELRRRFEVGLRPVPGMAGLIDRLAVPSCVASSSHTARLRRSLAVAGLLTRFDGAVFSADEVERGKPHPDLFLHVAARMGAAPERCLVIEDSLPGLMAARAAGMAAIAFTGGSHMRASDGAALAPLATALVRDAEALAPHLPLRP